MPPCMLCEIDTMPPLNELAFPELMLAMSADNARAAHQFAAECGGSPDQLNHYAWEHLSSTPGYWADNGPWEND